MHFCLHEILRFHTSFKDQIDKINCPAGYFPDSSGTDIHKGTAIKRRKPGMSCDAWLCLPAGPCRDRQINLKGTRGDPLTMWLPHSWLNEPRSTPGTYQRVPLCVSGLRHRSARGFTHVSTEWNNIVLCYVNVMSIVKLISLLCKVY